MLIEDTDCCFIVILTLTIAPAVSSHDLSCRVGGVPAETPSPYIQKRRWTLGLHVCHLPKQLLVHSATKLAALWVNDTCKYPKASGCPRVHRHCSRDSHNCKQRLSRATTGGRTCPPLAW